MNIYTFRTFIIVFFALLLAGPVSATIKPPIALQRTPLVLDTLTKAPGATALPAKKLAPLQKVVRPSGLVAVASTAPEQPAGAPTALQVIKIKGIVLNADGQPCPGASVYPAGAPRQLVVTDANGAFVLPVPVGEAVSLRVEYFGVGSSRVEVATPSAEVLRITLGK